MSLADNLLHISWSFDSRVKLRNITPLPCRNCSENSENPEHFIFNNSVLCKFILQLKSIGVHHALPQLWTQKLLLKTHAGKTSSLAISIPGAYFHPNSYMFNSKASIITAMSLHRLQEKQNFKALCQSPFTDYSAEAVLKYGSLSLDPL